MVKEIDKKSRLIQEVASSLGWNSNIEEILLRVKQLDKGLIKEDEFIYLLNWSNKFKLIHKLEQVQIPSSSKQNYVVPDLLVIHEHNGESTPYLIEIKTSKKNKLSWTEGYYSSLMNYSKIVNIPLLIAWKWDNLSLWTLFDINHFEKPFKNYKINYEKAHLENLLSLMMGDFALFTYDNFSLNFKFKKKRIIKEKGVEKDYLVTLEKFYYIGKDNKEIESINPSFFTIILSLFSEELIEEDDNYINIKFKPYDTSIFAQTILLNLTKGISNNNDIKWIELSKEKIYPIDYDSFLNLLNEGFDEGVIQTVLLPILPYSHEQNKG